MYEAQNVQIWTRQFHWEMVSQGSAQENTTLGTLSRERCNDQKQMLRNTREALKELCKVWFQE